jgi:hypothetical protein
MRVVVNCFHVCININVVSQLGMLLRVMHSLTQVSLRRMWSKLTACLSVVSLRNAGTQKIRTNQRIFGILPYF